MDKIPHFTFEQLSQEPRGTEFFITRPDGTRIKTITAGDGQTVLLAHGYGGSMQDWNLVFEMLKEKGFRVITFDQRGHEGSTIGSDGISSMTMATDCLAILEHFDIKDGILVGHSMGGFLGIIFMLNHAEEAKKRLKSVLLLSSFAGEIGLNNPSVRLQIPVIKSGLMQKAMQYSSLRSIIGRFSVGKVKNPAIIELSTLNFSRQNHLALTPVLKALSQESYYDRLAEISIPCTVLTGTADLTIPSFHSVKLAKGIRKAKLVLVSEIGHLFYWEKPEKIVEEILDLAKTER